MDVEEVSKDDESDKESVAICHKHFRELWERR